MTSESNEAAWHELRVAARAQVSADVDTLSSTELKEAVPPVFTEHIGRQLLAHLEQARAA